MEIRQRIIEEANRQFFRFGIRNVTMDEIAVNLGISKRTVYETFKDKNDLVKNCIEVITENHAQKVEHVISESENVIEAIFVFMREGIKMMNEINPVFFKDIEKLYPKTWKILETESVEKRCELSGNLIRNGIGDGFFRSDLNIGIVSKLFHAQTNLLIDEEIFPRDKYNYSEVFENMVINFVRGISTEKGIKVIDQILKP